jgi:hypothetical protein
VFLYCVDSGGSQQCGAAGSCRRMQDDGCTQGGGFVWRRGRFDGRPGKVDVWTPVLKMSLRKMEAAT